MGAQDARSEALVELTVQKTREQSRRQKPGFDGLAWRAAVAAVVAAAELELLRANVVRLSGALSFRENASGDCDGRADSGECTGDVRSERLGVRADDAAADPRRLRSLWLLREAGDAGEFYAVRIAGRLRERAICFACRA